MGHSKTFKITKADEEQKYIHISNEKKNEQSEEKVDKKIKQKTDTLKN